MVPIFRVIVCLSLILNGILWVVQLILNLVSGFVWYKRDYPENQQLSKGNREQTWMTRYTNHPKLHIVAIVVWTTIMISALLVFVIAMYGLLFPLLSLDFYPRSQLPGGDPILAIPAQALILLVLIILIFGLSGSKQLLLRILGEKGFTLGCDPYDSFVFGPIEPLLLCVIVTVLCVLANLPDFNYFMIDGLAEDIESNPFNYPEWYRSMFQTMMNLKAASTIFLIVPYVGVLVLSILNCKSK
jgi:hypothetical protein